MALPPLGTGAGNLDAEAAADAMMPVLRQHLGCEDYPKQVIVMVPTDYELDVFTSRLQDPEHDREKPSDASSSDDAVSSDDGEPSDGAE